MKPRNFEDIVATIALYRPGPMENIPEYLDRREHPEKIDYIHPDLKPFLKIPYGNYDLSGTNHAGSHKDGRFFTRES